MDVRQAVLESIGFQVWGMTVGDAPDGPVENLFARRGSGGRHFAFAGHTDVVPVGHGWTQEPFAGKIAGGMLHGRGAVDMKGAIAAFVAAAGRVRDHDGSLSLIITGDEEGAATFGTVKLLEWLEANGHVPDLCLVREPTSEHRLGAVVNIGQLGRAAGWERGWQD